MTGFWRRLAAHNAGFVARALRAAADALEALQPGSPALAFPVVFNAGEEQKVGEVTVQDTEAGLTASVVFLDAEGHPTTADDVPRWSSTDEAVATVTASEDGLSATVEVGGPGATVVEVRSTNADGSEVVSQGTITVQAGDAVIGSVDFAVGGAEPAPGGEPAEATPEPGEGI